MYRLKVDGSHLTFLWVLGHNGIKGNDAADILAKKATQPPQFINLSQPLELPGLLKH